MFTWWKNSRPMTEILRYSNRYGTIYLMNQFRLKRCKEYEIKFIPNLLIREAWQVARQIGQASIYLCRRQCLAIVHFLKYIRMQILYFGSLWRCNSKTLNQGFCHEILLYLQKWCHWCCWTQFREIKQATNKCTKKFLSLFFGDLHQK